jgi:hypothetical protein
MRDELRKQNSSGLSEEMRQMRAEARDLARREDEIAKQLADLEQNKQRILSDDGRRQKLADQLAQQRQRLTNLVNQAAQISEQAEATACFEAMETVRRYSVREARKKGGSVRVVKDSTALIGYYRDLMQAQGEQAPEGKLAAMQRVMQGLIGIGHGALFHVHDADDTLLYCVFYGWDRHRAYYLYGAGHPERSTPWQGTLAHWFAFGHLAREHGVTQVDLEGVNSPQRGWFKLGFGGSLQPYHTLHWGPSA